jgi:divalent metal cation (Fe/Co/Zn/Cd) transporter
MNNIKQIFVRSIGLILATFFGGTAIGSVLGDWVMGALIGVGSAFAVVATMVGVSLAWTGELTEQSITNAFRAAVSKAAEDNEQVKDALEVERDGDFTFDDVDWDDNDPEMFDENDK